MYRRKSFALLFALALLPALAAAPRITVRGKLLEEGGKPALETPEHKTVFLDGDQETLSVLNDKRLAGMEFELAGEFSGPDRFKVGSFYSKSMYVLKEGHRFEVTYWCPICSIRTYTPGKCMCCQNETHLDLREPGEDQ